jgi:hypothetical protein
VPAQDNHIRVKLQSSYPEYLPAFHNENELKGRFLLITKSIFKPGEKTGEKNTSSVKAVIEAQKPTRTADTLQIKRKCLEQARHNGT